MQFIDLKRQYSIIKDSVQEGIDRVLNHGMYIMGPEVFELEKKLAEYVGVKHCISCSSGTDALLMPLMALNIGAGDAVFTSPFTFIATAEVIRLAGATPVFVDIDERTYNIDPLKLEEAIKTTISKGELTPKAIMPVDLFGLPADYDAIDKIAKYYGLKVIEDAAQGFGGIYKGKKACSFGDVAGTSFFPAKPLGCYGDGGAIFTNDDNLKDLLVSIRIHGQGTDKYNNDRIGINGRLDSIQAAVILAKLSIFDNEISQRNKVAEMYSEALRGKVVVPFIPDNYTSCWAQYSILADDSEQRAIMQENLKNNGIPSAIYYIKPLHLQKAFEDQGYQAGDFPVSEVISQRIFSLPMHPYLTKDEIDLIAQTI